jgi:hypothetical protein
MMEALRGRGPLKNPFNQRFPRINFKRKNRGFRLQGDCFFETPMIYYSLLLLGAIGNTGSMKLDNRIQRVETDRKQFKIN